MFISSKSSSSSSRSGGTSRKNANSNKAASSSRSSNFKTKDSSSSSPPTTIELRGINIHFPFKPYPCQEKYMEKVLDALNNSENALLESPTGTGKTLCLLCSTLAWHMEQKGMSQHIGSDGGAVDASNDAATALNNGSRSSQYKKVPTIIYASRTHSQLSQVVKELRFTRYRPKHAVLGSREQMCIHPKVNPNKSKTSSSSNSNVNPITSTEINHACTKLTKERKCRYKNNLEGFVVTSNESSSCTSAGSENQQQQPVLDIEELVALGQTRAVCPFYLSRSHIENAEIIFIPYNYLFDIDARSNSLSDVDFENSIIIFDEAHNLESFASESASFDLKSVDIAGCILEISRCIGYIQSMPDLNGDGKGDGGGIKMDNLLRLKAIFLQLEHYIDEVIPNKGGSYSGEYIFEILAKGANLTYENHGIFLKFVREISDHIMEMRGDSVGGGSSRGGANRVSSGTPKLDHFVTCIKKVFNTSTKLQSIAKARSYRVHVSPKINSSSNSNKNKRASDGGGGGFVGNNSTLKNNGEGRTLSYWCFAPALAMNELAALKVRSILVTSGTLSPLPSYSLELGLPFPHTLENEHIISKEQISVRVIGKGVSGKVLTSTYNRRDNMEYITELGNTIISLSRVIPGGVLIFFPSYGVMETCIERWGGPISSRTKSQSYTKNKNSFFQVKPRRGGHSSTGGRYCFPQAPMLSRQNTSTSGAASSSQWQRLLAIKAIVLEPKTSSELKDVINEFDKFISLPKSSGCIMMGVCRGKISEGIDFADEKCRAVIITGLPFAPYLDPKVKLKREYLDAMKIALTAKPSGEGGFNTGKDTTSPQPPSTLSGSEWYSQQAHRAVNQAIGRVIRHRFDYGAILFLDSRFSETRNQNGVSKWIRPAFEPDKGVGFAIGSLVKFFTAAKVKTEASKEAYKGITKPPIKLQYEDELLDASDPSTKEDIDFDASITKVSFVKRTVNDEDDSMMKSGYVRPTSIIKQLQLNDSDDNGMNHSNEGKKTSSLSSGSKFTYETQIRRRIQHNANYNQQKNNATEEQRNDAKLFFELAKEYLTSPDFQNMRKFLITMKSYGDKQDPKAYLEQVKKLVEILLCYDPCRVENNHQKKSDQLVESLLPLLPPSHRYNIEKMACELRYNSSIFKHETANVLDSEDCDALDCSFPVLMINHDSYDNGAGKSNSCRNDLEGRQTVVKILLKNADKGLENMIQNMYSLLPKEQRKLLKTMINGYQASQNVKKMREMDRTKYGERGLNSALFQRPAKPSWNVPTSKKTQENNTIEDVNTMREALSRASTIKKDKYDTEQLKWMTSRNNLLEQNMKRKNATRNNSITVNEKKYKNFNAVTNIKPSKRSRSAIESARTKDDSLDKCLEQAKAEIYRKATPKKIQISRVKSNEKGILCYLCQTTTKTLIMAQCNHIACIDCWANWLKRSETCPSCRNATNKESLSRIIFHDEGCSLPSMTQLCASDDDDNEELEILGESSKK